ncbi:RraA family protein [Saliniramus sp.]|uniref:RraA family protein n=1 Tax=Saliniramus sp. TaxID=2986772 RepID=UPI002C692DEC|nr:RraA family protein [Saliniramus sp.]HMB09041.1 RraA family protein [Saliniramus sp.]
MQQELMTALKIVDTPSICNAIEVVQGKRGFDRYTRGTVLSSRANAAPIVGYAITARIAARALSTEDPGVIRERRMAYYKMMADAPRPGIAVVEDVDYPACVGAFWGEVNTTVHKGFGIGGALTNGVMRDLDALPDGFPVIAGSVGPSHAFVHVREIAIPVTVFGLTIHPGELIHADRHGALVIPDDVLSELPKAIAKMQATEEIVLGPARAANFDFAAFEKAWAAFEKART